MVASVAVFLSPTLLFREGLTGLDILDSGLYELVSMNAVNVLLFALLGMIAVVLAIHNALWPSMLRPLYALQKEGWAKSSKDIRKAGYALIAFGLALHPAILHFISKLGGLIGL